MTEATVTTPDPEPEKVNPKTGEIVPAEQVPTMPAVRPEEQSRAELYRGMATLKLSKDQIDILLAPVDPSLVSLRDDDLAYVQWVHFVRRLNRAFGPGGWGIEPRGNGMMKGSVWYKGALLVDGKVVKEATGDCKWQPSNARMTYASAVESAQSDCIVKCCKQLGIMSELWDKDWVEWWKKGEWKKQAPKGPGTTQAGPTETQPTGTSNDKLSPAQMKAIHGAASKKGYDHTAIHDYCVRTYGHGLSAMTIKEASSLIESIDQWQ